MSAVVFPPPLLGDEHNAIVPVRYRNSGSFDPAHLATLGEAITDYYQRSSYGLYVPRFALLNPVPIALSEHADAERDLAIRDALEQRGDNPGQYRRLLFIAPRYDRAATSPVGFGGQPGTGLAAFWPMLPAYAAVHEFGHVIGLRHSLRCPARLRDPAANCDATGYQYGDWSDVMGDLYGRGYPRNLLNAPHRLFLGWLPPERTATTEAYGDGGVYGLPPERTATTEAYMLAPLDQADGVAALVVEKPDTGSQLVLSGPTFEFSDLYVVSYRPELAGPYVHTLNARDGGQTNLAAQGDASYHDTINDLTLRFRPSAGSLSVVIDAPPLPPAPAALSGAVRYRGDPLRGVVLIARDDTGQVVTARTGPDGRYQLRLASGRWYVHATSTAGPPPGVPSIADVQAIWAYRLGRRTLTDLEQLAADQRADGDGGVYGYDAALIARYLVTGWVSPAVRRLGWWRFVPAGAPVPADHVIPLLVLDVDSDCVQDFIAVCVGQVTT